MRNYFIRRVTNEKGYTLVEGIIQLSILMIFAQVFAVTIGWTGKMEETITDPTDLEWLFFIQNVEQYLNNIDSLTIQKDQPGIRFRKDGEEYDIELYQDLIRKQKERLGHEQMLLHVKSLSMSVEGQTLRFFVTFANGMEKEHDFYVTFRSE
ncbi:competence type IV pilus minor pilin ComGF [Bacillus sp. FJAT-22090]|uniref:competence type IV pilus minor pilin ComGF n=1 Tax=Bacillus sp. FJAT-22090 TaxID=1581038 RepID=UPI0011A35956|nr:competence type IV pilus minor pilin ComGF [Bacillus sp. FJAT-22090]